MRISDWSSDVCSSDLEGTNSDQRRLTVQTTLLLVEICRQHTGRATHFAFLGAIENMRGPFKHMIDVVEQSRRIPGAPRGFVKPVDRRQLAAQPALPRRYGNSPFTWLNANPADQTFTI